MASKTSGLEEKLLIQCKKTAFLLPLGTFITARNRYNEPVNYWNNLC